jgi:EmrB/QacA subfamily drug resistance transporter
MVNVPIGIATFFVARWLLPRDEAEGGAGRLDIFGLVLASLGTVGITYGLSESATAGTFISKRVIIPVLVGIALLICFVFRSLRKDRPLLDLHLYRIRAFSAASVVMFCLGAALFGAMILLPLYFQIARGEDALRTGLLLIPQGIGSAIGMNRSASATHRLGAGLTCFIGGIVLSLGTLPFLFVGPDTSYAFIGSAMIVRGVGVGLAIMPAMTAAFSCLTQDQVSDASPQLNVIQRVGGSFGTAVIAVVLQSKLTRLPAHATASAVAACFSQTYWWVMILVLVALIPTVFLWRIERRTGKVESLEGEDLLIEAVA